MKILPLNIGSMGYVGLIPTTVGNRFVTLLCEPKLSLTPSGTRLNTPLKVLQYHPATDDIGTANRNLVLRLIRTSINYSIVDESINTAQMLFGSEPVTVYPYDWAVLESLFPRRLIA